jgi:hypothetical protein
VTKYLAAVCGSAVILAASSGMFAVTLAVLSAFTARAEDQPPVRDLSFFLHRLRSVDHMPELEASHTAMSSTWDRSGGNGDGTDFKNVVKPTADSPGRRKVVWPPPAYANRHVFARNDRELICASLAAEP